MEDNFASARLNSTIAQKYNMKTAKNNNKKAFIEEYYKAKGNVTDALIEQARIYTIIEKGIFPEEATTKEYYPVPITKELIDEIYKKIKLNSKENYIYFYESWRRKIDQGYYQEIVNSAFEDLKIALATYRKCNNPNWNVQMDYVEEGELKNLYLLLSQTKLNAGEINIRNFVKNYKER